MTTKQKARELKIPSGGFTQRDKFIREQTINEIKEILKEAELMSNKDDAFRYLWKEIKK
jgi:hypothetical protein